MQSAVDIPLQLTVFLVQDVRHKKKRIIDTDKFFIIAGCYFLAIQQFY